MRSLDEQMAILMRGVEFGDEQIRETMARELQERLVEGRPLRVYMQRTLPIHRRHARGGELPRSDAEVL